jgi:hypothetical protein
MKSNFVSSARTRSGASLVLSGRASSIPGPRPITRRAGLSPIRFVHENFSTLRHLSPAQAARFMQPYLS